jgi:hypothetical protein
VDCRYPFRLRAIIIVCICFAGEPAAAHAPFPEIGSFYSGLIHPFLALQEFLLIVSASLLLGRSGAQTAGTGLLTFIGGVVAGMMLPWIVSGPIVPVSATLALSLACAAALSLDIRPPRWAVAVASGLSGICVGVAVTPDEGPVRTMVLGGVGSALGASFLALVLAGVSLTCQSGWKVVLVRIIGAWIFAIGIMTVALLQRS